MVMTKKVAKPVKGTKGTFYKRPPEGQYVFTVENGLFNIEKVYDKELDQEVKYYTVLLTFKSDDGYTVVEKKRIAVEDPDNPGEYSETSSFGIAWELISRILDRKDMPYQIDEKIVRACIGHRFVADIVHNVGANKVTYANIDVFSVDVVIPDDEEE